MQAGKAVRGGIHLWRSGELIIRIHHRFAIDDEMDEQCTILGRNCAFNIVELYGFIFAQRYILLAHGHRHVQSLPLEIPLGSAFAVCEVAFNFDFVLFYTFGGGVNFGLRIATTGNQQNTKEKWREVSFHQFCQS